MRYLIALISAFALALTLIPAAPASAQTSSGQRCFAETGYCISGPIRSYWERNGGLAVFGYPISPLQTETIEGSWTGPTQWFQRDRLEDHSNEGKGVLAGRLGAAYLELQGRPWTYGPNRAPVSDCITFRQTGYSLCGAFRNYWEGTGGLERFGYPITGVIEENIEGRSYQVQYFERRRMEYHPENRGTPYEILLGLLGNQLYGGIVSPAPIDVELDQARVSIFEFFGGMASGDYNTASDLYGGDFRVLQDWNPDIIGDPYADRTVRAALLERGCEQNGLVCTPVAQIVSEGKHNAGYRFVVEFQWVDGGILRNPHNGQTRFTYDVQKIQGRYRVMDLPPYLS